MNMLVEALAWIVDPSHWSGDGSIGMRLLQHLLVSAAALVAAALIAIPIGIWIGHTRRGAGVVGAITGAARAIPTLGLLTLMGLLMGIGVLPPLLALIVLAIPSLLAGAYSGVRAIDPVIAESAKAIGMHPRQVIAEVEVPLAAPTIVGGVRAATLQVISTATLAAYTANIGLGRILFAGLKTRDYPQMLASALLVVLLALTFEVLFALLQRALQRTSAAVP